jgi:hypothetical protein
MKPIAKKILLLVNKPWPIYIQINIFIVDAINPNIKKMTEKRCSSLASIILRRIKGLASDIYRQAFNLKLKQKI